MTEESRETSPTSKEYLAKATRLLQAARREHPTAGVWEAADVQWWWRVDQHEDERRQLFFERGGEEVAAVSFTDWGRHFQCDLFRRDVSGSPQATFLLERASEMTAALEAKPIELFVPVTDDDLMEKAKVLGFVEQSGDVTSWLEAGNERRPEPLPAGYELVSRVGGNGPHPLVKRNGEHVEERLNECSLYRPDLDLAVIAPDGEVAGYGVFWADLTTGVGLVEPMRTEDEHQGKGLASHLLASGLERLRSAGCLRFKVSHDPGNPPAARLYRGVGFEPESETVVLVRPPA